jgi:hypothetical protein
MGVGSQRHAPAALLQGKTPGTLRTGGWVGPRVRVREISPPTGILTPGPSSTQQVAIPTELSRPTRSLHTSAIKAVRRVVCMSKHSSRRSSRSRWSAEHCPDKTRIPLALDLCCLSLLTCAVCHSWYVLSVIPDLCCHSWPVLSVTLEFQCTAAIAFSFLPYCLLFSPE